MGKIFTKEENQKWAYSLNGKMCSACLIIKHGNEVLMVKAGYKDHWTFPSGIVDTNESPMSAALREAKEETGLVFKKDECESFATIYTSAKEPGDRDRFNFSFITEVYKKPLCSAIPNDEIEEYSWVTFEKIAEMSKNKGSYIQFQDMLLNHNHHTPYKEI